MRSIDNKIIVEGIRKQDKKILKDIYFIYFPDIKKYILDNTGSIQDAKDIFQEAIIIVYRKAKERNLIIPSSFKLYIFAVCRYIWIKQLSKQKENIENQNIYI